MAEPTPRRLRFARAAHIKLGRDFTRLRLEGRRLNQGCLVANWRVLAPGGGSRLGVVVAGRIGNSVLRSRVKRLLRESFRLHQHDLVQPVDLVLVARPSIAGLTFAAVERDFLTSLRKARLLKGTGGQDR